MHKMPKNANRQTASKMRGKVDPTVIQRPLVTTQKEYISLHFKVRWQPWNGIKTRQVCSVRNHIVSAGMGRLTWLKWKAICCTMMLRVTSLTLVQRWKQNKSQCSTCRMNIEGLTCRAATSCLQACKLFWSVSVNFQKKTALEQLPTAKLPSSSES